MTAQAKSDDASGAPEVKQSSHDAAEELATTLESEYTIDGRPTREAVNREVAIKNLFVSAKLDGKGHLQEVACRESICRGVIKIANESADNEVFSRTFLSSDFMLAIPSAVSVTSREKVADGSIIATFYIHPQSVFEMLSHVTTEE